MMRQVIGAVIGTLAALAVGRWSASLGHFSYEKVTVVSWIRTLQIFFGLTTGSILASRDSESAFQMSLVSLLLISQTPLDLVAHKLARTPTILAGAALSVFAATRAMVTGEIKSNLVAAFVALGLSGTFRILNLLSPNALGFGDVLLVYPLALAVALVEIDLVQIWIVLSTCLATLHALLARLVFGARMIPLGPHLLFGAWIVLLRGV